MQFARQTGRVRLLLLACTALGLSACAATPPIAGIRTACASLLPSEWVAGVAGAPLPVDQTVGAWIVFGDAQTGQLDKANGRTADAIGIVTRCEARDVAAERAATKRWWQIWK